MRKLIILVRKDSCIKFESSNSIVHLNSWPAQRVAHGDLTVSSHFLVPKIFSTTARTLHLQVNVSKSAYYAHRPCSMFATRRKTSSVRETGAVSSSDHDRSNLTIFHERHISNIIPAKTFLQVPLNIFWKWPALYQKMTLICFKKVSKIRSCYKIYRSQPLPKLVYSWS